MVKRTFSLAYCIICLVGIIGLVGCRERQSDNTAAVQKIVAGMTLEEKAQLVVGCGSYFDIPDSILKLLPGGKNPLEGFMKKPEAGSSQLYVPGAAGTTFELKKFGITSLVLTDGPAGLRINPKRKGTKETFYCTAFPVATVLASTWDTSVVRKVGEAMGNEVHEYGSDILLAPALNIQRNPLCGRNFEYYSEDPVIAGKMASAMVKGIQSQGVGTSIKHFVANNQETNRRKVNEIISQRALREIYLKGFRIAVQEGEPWTVMSSYNKVNGVYTSERYDLITNVLRDDWGFKGFVMTDWDGGIDPVAQMKAGNDLIEPGNTGQTKKIIEAVKSGKLTMQELDRNVTRILNGMMNSPRHKNYVYSNKPDLAGHALVVRQAGSDGMVLLKNMQSTLPVSHKKVALFGNSSYEIIKGGTGSGDVNASYCVGLPEGLMQYGMIPNESLKTTYLKYLKEFRANSGYKPNFWDLITGKKSQVPEMPVDNQVASKMAEESDIAFVTIGRNSGEGSDRKIEGDFNLSASEKSLIQTVSEAYHSKGKRVVVILNIGGVIETASWKNFPDAILLAWQPGEEAGNSMADVLCGNTNPSGRLAASFPVNYQDVPTAKNFPGVILSDTSNTMNGEDAHAMEVVYDEGIYVGYRYYQTFHVPVSYEFGYGLSYTNFDFKNLKLSTKIFKDQLIVSVDVINSGKFPGKEVVQLYLKAPEVSMDKPEQELKAFAKTKMLDPGAIETVQFIISASDLASFDTTKSSWVADAGNYLVRIGASSEDIRQTLSFDLEKPLMVQKVSRALDPKRPMNLLKR